MNSGDERFLEWVELLSRITDITEFLDKAAKHSHFLLTKAPLYKTLCEGESFGLEKNQERIDGSVFKQLQDNPYSMHCIYFNVLKFSII